MADFEDREDRRTESGEVTETKALLADHKKEDSPKLEIVLATPAVEVVTKERFWILF